MFARRLRWTRHVALSMALQVSVVAASPAVFAQARPQVQGPDLVARGRALFDDQQYEESVQTLSAALLRPNNTKAQRVEIYRLLALNYITINRKEEAESAVRGLLALQPDYALPATESPRFRDFFADVRKRWEGEGRPGLVRESEPSAAPVTMQHASPSQVDPRTQINLTARLTDPQGRVTGVKLYFRSGSKGKFDAVDATLTGPEVRASIPPASVKPPLVEYYLLGVDKGGLPVVSRGDASAPLRVAVPEPNRGWILPVAIGGGVAVTALAIVGGILLFHKSTPGKTIVKTPPPPPPTKNTSDITINIGD